MFFRIFGTVCIGISFLVQLSKNKYVFNWMDGTKGAYLGTCIVELAWRGVVILGLWVL